MKATYTATAELVYSWDDYEDWEIATLPATDGTGVKCRVTAEKGDGISEMCHKAVNEGKHLTLRITEGK